MSEQDTQTADIDGDGVISKKEKELMIEKIESQQKMAWLAFLMLIACGGYLMFFAPIERIEAAGSGVFDMFWLTLASIIGFFFGATAYASKK